MDKISVIIPAYNAEKYIKEAIASVLDQTYRGDYEIIVVNNGSTDNTFSVVEELAEEHPCIRLFSKPFGCASTSRNMALQKVCGNLIFFHDADDVLEPEALSLLYEKLCETGADCVTALARDFRSPELVASGVMPAAAPGPAYRGALTGCALFRKASVDAVGGFDESLSSGETVDWMLRFQDKGFTTECIDVVTKNRRIHLTNTTQIFKVNYADALRKRMKARSGTQAKSQRHAE